MVRMASPNQFRLFLALQSPDHVRQELANVQLELRQALPASTTRWTPPDQFHLTLKFLGNVPVERLDELQIALRQALNQTVSFDLTAAGMGFFPNIHRPHVIWTGVSSPASELECLFQVVQEGSRAFSNEPDQEKFVGHITLGRIKMLKRQEAGALKQIASTRKETNFGHWVAQNVDVMRSELSSQGAVHKMVASIHLETQQASR
jgi:2'-5' RNA ligase